MADQYPYTGKETINFVYSLLKGHVADYKNTKKSINTKNIECKRENIKSILIMLSKKHAITGIPTKSRKLLGFCYYCCIYFKYKRELCKTISITKDICNIDLDFFYENHSIFLDIDRLVKSIKSMKKIGSYELYFILGYVEAYLCLVNVRTYVETYDYLPRNNEQ